MHATNKSICLFTIFWVYFWASKTKQIYFIGLIFFEEKLNEEICLYFNKKKTWDFRIPKRKHETVETTDEKKILSVLYNDANLTQLDLPEGLKHAAYEHSNAAAIVPMCLWTVYPSPRSPVYFWLYHLFFVCFQLWVEFLLK